MLLNVNHIIESSKVQGPGDRFTIWVQGCSIHCLGCMNHDTWEFNTKQQLDTETLASKVLNSLSTGLTLTGGEPLDQLEAILDLVSRVFEYKNIFLCSGYTFDHIRNHSEKKKILNFVDILCTGPFELQKVCQSEWKGSSNQEVIYLTDRGKTLLNLPIYKREYRIDKNTGSVLITGFSIC
jgi:anaerobic ribonucleoside-triphosphate reductase activating protein